MDDLALFLHGDGTWILLTIAGWFAAGLLVAPVVPRLAREAGMPRGAGWTLAVVLLGPAALTAFLVARRRQIAFAAALRAEGITLEPVSMSADPAARAMILSGVVLMLIGLALSLALSSDGALVVFVGFIVGGAVLAMRGFIRREGAFRASSAAPGVERR